MKEELRLFIKGLINDVPPVVYIGLVAVFCFGTVFLIVFKGRKNINGLCRLLLLEYIALIYCSTVIFRKVNDVRKYEYIPFWSYDNMELLVENIMNVIIPQWIPNKKHYQRKNRMNQKSRVEPSYTIIFRNASIASF